MADAIVDGTGSGNFWRITQSGAGLVTSQEASPLDDSKNNPAWKFEYAISGTAAGVTGSTIGSITQTIGTGSFVQTFTWDNDLVTNISEWS